MWTREPCALSHVKTFVGNIISNLESIRNWTTNRMFYVLDRGFSSAFGCKFALTIEAGESSPE